MRYLFSEVGDGIPSHKHLPELAHNTEVVEGSVLITDSSGSRVFRAGQTALIDWANPHQIEALKAPTVIVNWLYEEQHAGFEDWPEWEEPSQLHTQ
jgi:hypothetical protein